MMKVSVMIGRTMLGNNSPTDASVGTIVIAGNHSKRMANIKIRIVAVTKPGRVIPTIEDVDTKISGHLSRESPAITPKKMRHLTKAALCYLREFALEDEMCRFDVLGIMVDEEGLKIELLKDVFEASM